MLSYIPNSSAQVGHYIQYEMQKLTGDKNSLFLLLATVSLMVFVLDATAQAPNNDEMMISAGDAIVTQSNVESKQNETEINKPTTEKVCKDIGETCTISADCCSERCLTYLARCVT